MEDNYGRGNCLFRSLSMLAYGTMNQHILVRSAINDWMEAHRAKYTHFMEDNAHFDEYIAKMRKAGTWGGNQELVAAGELYGFKFDLYSFSNAAPTYCRVLKTFLSDLPGQTVRMS